MKAEPRAGGEVIARAISRPATGRATGGSPVTGPAAAEHSAECPHKARRLCGPIELKGATARVQEVGPDDGLHKRNANGRAVGA